MSDRGKFGQIKANFTPLFWQPWDNRPWGRASSRRKLRQLCRFGAAGSRGRLTAKPLYYQEVLPGKRRRGGTKIIAGAYSWKPPNPFRLSNNEGDREKIPEKERWLTAFTLVTGSRDKKSRSQAKAQSC
jgi:hypothetical protein